MRNDWYYGPYPHGVESWLGPVFMVVILALLVVGVVLVVRALTSRRPHVAPNGTVPTGAVPAGGPSGTAGTALRILEERYARGEIDRDEFLERRHDLTAPPQGGVWHAPGPGAGQGPPAGPPAGQPPPSGG